MWYATITIWWSFNLLLLFTKPSMDLNNPTNFHRQSLTNHILVFCFDLLSTQTFCIWYKKYNEKRCFSSYCAIYNLLHANCRNITGNHVTRFIQWHCNKYKCIKCKGCITTSNLQQQKYLQLKISNLMHIHINQLFSWFWIKPESLRFSSNADSTCPNLYYNIIK